MFETAAPKLGFEVGSRETIPKETRRLVWQRDDGACNICGATQKLHFDHIIPVSKGGNNHVDNIQNSAKAVTSVKEIKFRISFSIV